MTIVGPNDDIITVHYTHKGKSRVVDLDLSKQYMKMFIGDENG